MFTIQVRVVNTKDKKIVGREEWENLRSGFATLEIANERLAILQSIDDTQEFRIVETSKGDE